MEKKFGNIKTFEEFKWNPFKKKVINPNDPYGEEDWGDVDLQLIPQKYFYTGTKIRLTKQENFISIYLEIDQGYLLVGVMFKMISNEFYPSLGIRIPLHKRNKIDPDISGKDFKRDLVPITNTEYENIIPFLLSFRDTKKDQRYNDYLGSFLK